MDNFYGTNHRALQDEFKSRELADRLETLIVRQSFNDAAQKFVQQCDFFFLSTVDQQGFPTVSHKGGDPGFVKVTGPSSLLFPCYDGNGMWLSMGNLDTHPEVGLLFINFEQPHRVRIQGRAKLMRDAATLSNWPEVGLAVAVQITNLWINCPRYIHPATRVAASEFVPRADCTTPQPEWKTMAALEDVVPPLPHTVKNTKKR